MLSQEKNIISTRQPRSSNKFFAVSVAFSSFLWFRNINIHYSKIINTCAAATFGVLLIHANSDAMRTWLWKDTLDVMGHYSLPLGQLVLYSIGVVLGVFYYMQCHRPVAYCNSGKMVFQLVRPKVVFQDGKDCQ